MKGKFKNLIWDVSEEEYRNDSAISYSTLSSFAKKGLPGLLDSINRVPFSSPSLRHGSLVDNLLTNSENFNSLYIVADYKNPSEDVRDIMDSILSYANDNDLALESLDTVALNCFTDVLNIIETKGYGGSNWKSETKVRKVIEEGKEYYDAMQLANEGKELISSEELNYAENCVKVIKTNDYTKYLFANSENNENIELYFQSKFKITFSPTKEIYNIYKWKDEIVETDTIRCMFDMIYIDHITRTIKPIDLKTTYQPESEFGKAFITWRYDLQATMYSYILREVVKNSEEFSNYTVLPFHFLPINKETLLPQFFVYNKSLNNSQDIINGPNNEELLPWYKLLDDVKWHIKNNEFKYSRDAIDNNGITFI